MAENSKENRFAKYLNKSYWNVKNIITAVTFILFVIQFLFIAYINIFQCYNWLDHDASMTYSHAIELFKHKTYVLKEFNEETFLHIDTAMLLAVPLYGLTKDIFLAYGISNIIFVIIALFVISDLIDKYCTEKSYKYAALFLFLIPYRMGMLQYTTMIFFECAFYSFCILVPILLIDLLLYKKEDAKGLKYWALFALYVFMTFVTAFSRGTYAFLVALAPIILCYVLEIILSRDGLKRICKSKVIVIAATLLAYVAGLGLQMAMHITLGRTEYALVSPSDLIDNFKLVIWGYFSIFVGRIASPSVLSLEGIKILIMLGFGIITFVIILFNLRHAFKEEEYSNELRYLSVIFAWNFCVLGLTQCCYTDVAFPERYLFPGFVPILLSTPIVLSYIAKTERVLLRNSYYFVLSVLAILTMLVANSYVMLSFSDNLERNAGIKETLQCAKENGIDTVFFVKDGAAGLIARSYEPEMKVVSIEIRPEDNSYFLNAREFYKCAHDRGFYGDANVLAIPWDLTLEGNFEEYLTSSYAFLKDVKDYHLYVSDVNKFDDMEGFPLKDDELFETVDFAYSDNYITLGEIDAYGYLESVGNGDYILVSGELKAPYATSEVTVNYEMGLKTKEDGIDSSTGSIGTLMILDAGLAPVYTEDMVAEAGSATLTTDYLGPCYVAVKLNEGVKISIHDIHFKTIQ